MMPPESLGSGAEQLLASHTPEKLPPNTTSALSLYDQLTSNPFFTAGFGLAALAAIAQTGRRGLKYGAGLMYKRMLVDVEITRNDEAYPWILQWITAHQGHNQTPATGLISRLLQKATPGLHHLQLRSSRVTLPDGSLQTQFSLVPGLGRHMLRYRNAFIAVNREREKSFDLATGTPFETVTLKTLYAHRHILEDLLHDAQQKARAFQEGKTIMYTSWGSDWKEFGKPKRKRPLESVILEKGLTNRILDDVKGFLDARTWYLDRGIPYRRGYLLHGPPGTGKSSFIQALAGELDFNIALLNVNERGLTDDKLNHLLTIVPPRTIVLLEDADAAWVNRRSTDEHGYAGATVTFSGLLNALDGVASGEERIIFLTTNHVDRLDEALIRPGRIDMSVMLGYATDDQIGRLWDRFYAEFDQDGTGRKRFMDRAQQLNLLGTTSTAALQGLFLYNKDSPEGAISMADSLSSKSNEPSSNKQTTSS